jgi:hypothetical protein
MKTSRLSSSRAFSFVEVMTALIIFGLVMAGIMPLFFYALQNNYVSEQRLLANDDVRFFSEKLVANARASNQVLLYPAFFPYNTWNYTFPFTGTTSYSTSANPSVTAQIGANTALVPGNEVPLNGTGDYLVFVSYDDPCYGFTPIGNNGTIPNLTINRLILYFIAPNNVYNGSNGQPAEQAMYMYDSGVATTANPVALPWTGGQTLPITTNGNTLESLLPIPPSTWSAATAPWAQIVLNDIRGLSTDKNGLTFQSYSNSQNSSMIMSTLIIHGNVSKRVTDTYNFTITPGG